MRSFISICLGLVGVCLLMFVFQWKALALPREVSATGDECTIDLPNGLKKPGKLNKNGKCCSIWDSSECYDVPKSPSAINAAKAAGKAFATIGTTSGTKTTSSTGVRNSELGGKLQENAVPVRSASPGSSAAQKSQKARTLKSPSPSPSSSPKSQG